MDCNRPRPETAVDDRDLATPDALFRAHGQAVFAVCLANTRNHHDAEDIMQAVFLKSIAKVSSVREPARVRAWLMQVARRLCVDFIAGGNRRSRWRPRRRRLPHKTSLIASGCTRPSGNSPRTTAKSSSFTISTGESVRASPLRWESPNRRSGQRLRSRQGDAPRFAAGGPNMKPARQCKDRSDDIVALVMDELNTAAAQELQEHLAVCDACRASSRRLDGRGKDGPIGFRGTCATSGRLSDWCPARIVPNRACVSAYRTTISWKGSRTWFAHIND